MEGVGLQDGLDHDEGLGEVLPGKVVPIIRRLVRAVVEDLKEWRPSKMEHELHLQRKKNKAYSCHLPRPPESRTATVRRQENQPSALRTKASRRGELRRGMAAQGGEQGGES